MLRRSVAATLMLLVLGGFALAETYQGSLVELTASKLAILVRVKGEKKSEKKVLDVVAKVRVSQPQGDREKVLPFAEVQKLVMAVAKEKGVRGVAASVSTDASGRVVAIKLGKGGLPEKAAEILKKADRIELYSLEPEPDPKMAKAATTTFFHGWPVLGKTAIKEGKARKAVQDVLDLSVGRGRYVKCFDPRHGIRATHGDETVDMVICFRCMQIEFYYDPKKDKDTGNTISRVMQPAFDEILKTAGVPLAAPKK
jgi:hypothetical protein